MNIALRSPTETTAYLSIYVNAIVLKACSYQSVYGAVTRADSIKHLRLCQQSYLYYWRIALRTCNNSIDDSGRVMSSFGNS